MMHHSRFLLPVAAVVAVLQIAFLASMITSRAAILRDGREVVLEVQPIDPRDLLRGDYVVIGYNISVLPAEIVEANGDTDSTGPYPIVVRLREGDNGIWNAVAARFAEPPATPAEPNDVDLRGTTWTQPGAALASLSIDYGIERFYVPEGEGRPIEEGVRTRSFTMRIAVASDGAAQIKSLHDGDTMIFAEPLY